LVWLRDISLEGHGLIMSEVDPTSLRFEPPLKQDQRVSMLIRV